MNVWLFISYQKSAGQSDERVLSIFLAGQVPNSDEFDASLTRELQNVGPVDAVHVVGYQTEIDALRRWLTQSDTVSLERVLGAIGSRSDALRFFTFDPLLGKHTCSNLEGQPLAQENLIQAERRDCLTAAFRNAGGEESAPTGTHFAKASEKHCDRFLRVSNALEHGANVQLVAFWLLPYLWNTDARHVVVDTSGIYSVALTTVHQATMLGGLSHQPLVWSHRSHEGVDEIPVHIAREALFLVSASTSNGLVRRLIERGALRNRVVTLFSLSSDEVDGIVVLCDLRGDGETGIKPIKNHEASNCEYCSGHFHLINIQGDQFTIAPPKIRSIEIKAKDMPEKVRPTLSAMAGLRSFYAYRRRIGDRVCSLGLDVGPLLANPFHDKCRALQVKLKDKWEAFSRRSQTVTLRTVVAASYPGSEQLAQEIGEYARGVLKESSNLMVVDPDALRHLPPQPGTSTIVIAACVDESSELQGISRTLRDVQESGSISYISVAQMMAPEHVNKRLKSNLTQGALGPGTFSYFVGIDIPVECYEDLPSWRAELEELQRLCAWADRVEKDIPVEIERRIFRLLRAPSDGLVDDLFWPNEAGQVLCLRSDFTLIDGSLQEPGVSQADLFAVISVVLTSLRHSTDGTRRLAHNGYERSVLSPSNFDRLNDGVLQACLLRAARPKELAYGACNESLSEEMLAILMYTLPDAQANEKSEALIEFALALMTGRMTLSRRDIFKFADCLVEATDGRWPVAALMGSYLKAKVSGEIS